jgi:hypothetical protein
MNANGWRGGQRVDSTRQSMCSTQVDRTLRVHLCPRVRSNDARVDKRASGIEDARQTQSIDVAPSRVHAGVDGLRAVASAKTRQGVACAARGLN